MCPAPLLPQPQVQLIAAIEGCDYLSAIAEDRHVRGMPDCEAIRRSVAADANSRVHVLSRKVADSLRAVFAHQFGFLRWTDTAHAGSWIATVHLNQVNRRNRGTDGTFEVTLRSPAGVDTASEAHSLEKFVAIEQLYHQPKTEQAASAIAAQWADAVRDSLESKDGFRRGNLVRHLFSNIPIATLTPAQAKPSAEGQIMWATVPVRDSDIRVKPSHRPTFVWHVEKLERGAVDDEAEFRLGECTGKQGYLCKMLKLRYGGAPFEKEQIKQFFETPTQFHPPIALHVVEYRPAAVVCARQGVIP